MKYLCGSPISIVDIADDFYEAFERCGEEKNTRRDEFGRTVSDVANIPKIVNGTFALELYLKSFISKRQIRIRKLKHNISDIFFALKPNLQNQIREMVSPKLEEWNQKFDEALYGISDAFVFFRYIYEKSKLIYGFNMSLNVLPIFLDTVRAIVKSNQKTD